MGMYTEIFVSTRIVDKKEVTDILSYMLGLTEVQPELPDHPLFKADRWQYMFTGNSYYFVPRSMNLFDYDKIGNYWVLISRSDIKNYSGEIEKFFDWIMPYIESYGMIGYSRYEECWEPTVYYKGEK